MKIREIFITMMKREKAANLLLFGGMINLKPGAVTTELMVIRIAIGKLAVYRSFPVDLLITINSVPTLPGFIYLKRYPFRCA